MVARNGMIAVAATALAVCALVATPLCGRAQEDATAVGSTTTAAENAQMNKKVTLVVESADLYYTLKLLFAQVKADFALDTSLRGTPVTVSLHDQPFRVALETVLKASPTQLTYRVENGIYSVVPKVENLTTVETGTGAEQPVEVPKARAQKIMKGSAFVYNPLAIIEALGGRVIYAFRGLGGGAGGGMGGNMGAGGSTGYGGMSSGLGGSTGSTSSSSSGGYGGSSGGFGGSSGGSSRGF